MSNDDILRKELIEHMRRHVGIITAADIAKGKYHVRVIDRPDRVMYMVRKKDDDGKDAV